MDLRSRKAQALKRAIDAGAAVVLLVVGVPLGLFAALLIKLEDGGPVVFRQTRIGRNGGIFTLFKLRSMHPGAEEERGPQWAVIDDARVTKVGRWIRALRIDEIPQAWNVLRGDMSFCGPRPERPEFLEELRAAIPGYDRRHTVRPGITGWAQVNQPYSATVADAEIKAAFDLDYLERYSVAFDIRIMFRTLRIIAFGWGAVRRQGRNAPAAARSARKPVQVTPIS